MPLVCARSVPVRSCVADLPIQNDIHQLERKGNSYMCRIVDIDEQPGVFRNNKIMNFVSITRRCSKSDNTYTIPTAGACRFQIR